MKHSSESDSPEPNKSDLKILKEFMGYCKILSETHSLKKFMYVKHYKSIKYLLFLKNSLRETQTIQKTKL